MRISDNVRLIGVNENLFEGVQWKIIEYRPIQSRVFFVIQNETFGTRIVQKDEIELLSYTDYDLGI